MSRMSATMTSLDCIEVEAFKVFAERASLSIAGLRPGVYLVRGRNLTNDRLGSNGSGKSTFFSDAISWCLWGRTVEGLRTTDVRSWLTKFPPQVALTFSDGGSKRVIQRGPRATELTVDGRLVDQKEVDSLVLPFAAGSQAVIWGQGMPLFFDLTATAKMELLSETLGLERWERRAQAAGARARKLAGRLAGLEGELRGLEAAREHAQDALAAARDAAESWGRGQAGRIEKTEGEARAARGRANLIEIRRGEASLAAEGAGLAARSAREVVAARRKSAADHRREADRAGAGLARLRSVAGDLEANLASFESAGKCPTCGQTFGKKNAARHAVEYQARLAELLSEIKKARTECAKAEEAAAKLEARLAEEDAELEDLERAERQAELEEALLARELAGALAAAAAAEEASRQAATEINPHREAAQAARSRLREVAAEIKEKEELSRKIEASAERAQFWARGFRDIRLGIMDDLLDDLRETTAEVLDGLGLGEWTAEYATERETKSGSTQRALHVILSSPTAPSGVRWENYSGGERQRLRLAGALALSEVLLAQSGARVDFRVLDEPTRGLSGEGVSDLVEVLGNYARSGGLRIFVIDHMAIDGAEFAGTIVIERKKSGLALELEA